MVITRSYSIITIQVDCLSITIIVTIITIVIFIIVIIIIVIIDITFITHIIIIESNLDFHCYFNAELIFII